MEKTGLQIEMEKSELDIHFDTGLSAYDIAVKNGYVGTESSWLDSLKAPATEAAAAANSAAQSANSAATAANDAAEEAQEAATAANKAASSADTAKKNADTATSAANTATANAVKATENADAATQKANTAAAAANKAKADCDTAVGEAQQATEAATNATDAANDAAEEAQEAAAAAENATENVLLTLGRLVPTGMTVESVTRLTFGNVVPNYIKPVLVPSDVMKNVIFISDNKAVTVSPDGRITVVGKGRSTVHVIPACNTALARTLLVEVVAPAIRKASPDSLRLTQSGRLRLG